MVGCGAEAMSGDVSNSDKPTDDAGAASDGATSAPPPRKRKPRTPLPFRPLAYLPEFASDADIGVALMGERAAGFRSLIPLLERQARHCHV
jgi:hypothetical protein